MQSYPIAANEHERIKELQQLEVLDTPAEKDFDDIVLLTAKTFAVPVSCISLIDAERQWFKARLGLPVTEIERVHSFCNYTIMQNEILEVNDLATDERFHNFTAVKNDPNLRYYAGVPLTSSRGFNVGTLCIFDVTPRQLTADQKFALQVLSRHTMRILELRMRNRELQHMAEMQNKIISIIGHDIRNPLASFRVMLDLMDDKSNDFDEAEAAEMNNLLRKQMDSTLDLLSNLVQWGKLHIRLTRIKPEKTNFRALAAHALQGIEASALFKGNQLINHVPEDACVYADEQAIEFVLRNLLTNANKFTEKGSITVSLTQENYKQIITVSDTGVGMEEQQVKKVLFETGSHYTIGTQNEKGSGLGLSLVREFLIKINSALTIISTSGKGTSVSFNING